MRDLEKQREALASRHPGAEPADTGADYPASIEKMSEKWRAIKGSAPAERQSFLERHFLAVGIALGLLLVSLLTVVGGFVFLVWNAR